MLESLNKITLKVKIITKTPKIIDLLILNKERSFDFLIFFNKFIYFVF